MIALVPALIGAIAGQSLADALAQGYQPAMIVMGALCVAAALIAGVFVTDDRTAAPAPRVAPPAPDHGCVLPLTYPATP